MAYPQDKFSSQSVSDCSQLRIILAPESQTDICNLYSQLHCSQEQEMQATPRPFMEEKKTNVCNGIFNPFFLKRKE